MRFSVPLSDSETESESDNGPQLTLNKSSSSKLKWVDDDPRISNPRKTSSRSNTDLLGSSSTSNKSSKPPLSRSLAHSSSGSSKNVSKLKQPGATYSVGLPVPKSDTTPSPFAVVPLKLKSSSPGFPLTRSTLRVRLDEQSDSSSDEDGHESPDSEEEQWPIGRSKSERLENDPAIIPHVLPDHDAVSIWEQKERQSTYQLSMQNAAARRRHFEGIHVRTLARANECSQLDYKQKMNELSEVLARIGLDKEKEMKLVAEGFEKREKERARAFKALISEAEKLEQEEILRQNRIKQEEAARKAELERQQILKQQELEERKAREAELKRQKEQELKDQLEREKKEQEALKLLGIDLSCVESARKDYERWYSTMQQIKSTVLPAVSSNERFKTVCRQAKRKITPKVGQLTNGSRQIEKVIMELGDVLRETRKTGQEVYLWACNHLSKALIKQAETEVTAKLSTVYPLARLVVGLILVGYPELGEILMARLVKKCYFVAAYRPMATEGMDEGEYRKLLGYKPENSSQEETKIQYNNRMAGIVALFAAIKQTDLNDVVPSLKGTTDPKRFQRIPSELRLDSSWNWISTMLKPPMIGLTPSPRVITSFLEVSAGRLFEVYGIQFIKLLKSILHHGIERAEAHPTAKFSWDDPDCKPSIFQLQGLLEDFLNKDILSSRDAQACTGRFYQTTYH